MKPPVLNSKRNFLKLLGAGAGYWLLRAGWSVPLGLAPETAVQRVVKDCLKRLFPHPGSAAAIGRETRENLSKNETLERFLDHQKISLKDFLTYDAEALRKHLEASIQKDFRYRETVRIQGWILSRTEADLCRLAAAFAI